MCETKKFLGSKFNMKDFGKTEVILGIRITRTPDKLKLSQEHYVENILRKFKHFDCKPMSTLYDPNSQLKKNKEHSVAQIEYVQIIGSLIWLANCTKLDFAYVVGRLSWYTQVLIRIIGFLFIEYLSTWEAQLTMVCVMVDFQISLLVMPVGPLI